jgi:CsoR family transcriptional regulator, copper-sensing transcriptional repressor
MAAKKVIQKNNADEGTLCTLDADLYERKAVDVDPAIKTSNLRRLRRIEGQIRGLQRMVEEDRYCADILTQVSSAQEALRAVARALMRNHLAHCATHAIRSGSAEDRQAMYDELLEMIYKNAR